jgi:hypothetical protein
MQSQNDAEKPLPADVPPSKAARPSACHIEPIEQTRYLFVDAFQLVRIKKGEKPAERAVFRKQHGVAKARLSVLASCPAAFRVGLWAGGPYVAWMRWSSDAPPNTADQENSTLGLAVKLFGVQGRTLATDDPLATNADLLFQNSDIFFVDNIHEMCAISDDDNAFEANHKRTSIILDKMKKRESSVLTAQFSSTLPYALGDAIVKCRLVAAPPTGPAGTPGSTPNYLAEDLKQRLQAGPAAYLLEAQSFVDQSVTPIDRATVHWKESIAPFVTIARIDIDAQDIDAPGQSAYGESLAFSPWRTLHENRPLGSIADARRVAYPSSAAVRRSLNGQPMQEPKNPR